VGCQYCYRQARGKCFPNPRFAIHISPLVSPKINIIKNFKPLKLLHEKKGGVNKNNYLHAKSKTLVDAMHF
ncbi:MAG: hypothetical protein ABR535_05855, partial [Pyrinomonadaceae bacterium]